MGKSRESEGQPPFEAASNMQGSFADDDNYQAVRSIQNAYNELVREMGEYVVGESSAQETDNMISDEIDENEQLTMRLKLPANFMRQAADEIGSAAHQFVVNRALFDWFTITHPQGAELYLNLSTKNIDSMKRVLNKRVRPERPSYAPSGD